jgi:hypothetical protein
MFTYKKCEYETPLLKFPKESGGFQQAEKEQAKDKSRIYRLD